MPSSRLTKANAPLHRSGDESDDSRRPVMVRVPESILARTDRAARRLGLSRAAFMLCATVEKLERMEG